MACLLWVLLCVSGCVLAGSLGSDSDTGRAEAAVSLVRPRRQVEIDRGTHLRNLHLPGAITARGFPNTLLQTDRSRRHLNNKRKVKRKSRIGSFSLLSNTGHTPLKVVRAHRQTADSTPADVKRRVERQAPTQRAMTRGQPAVGTCS